MTMKHLFIDLTSPTASDASWVVLDESGVLQQSTQSANIEELQAFSQGYDTTVIIPGQDVLLTHAQLPKLNRQRLLQALPFALEEQLIEDVKDLHFAIDDYQTNGNVPVAIITRQKLEAYLDCLKKLGISPRRMIPATLALPYTENHWHLYINHNTCLMRMGKNQGFACDHANIDTLLALQIDASPIPPDVLQINYYSSAHLRLPISSFKTEEIHAENQTLLEYMSLWLYKNASMNLLQGPYQSRQHPSLTKKIWLASAYLAAAWIGLVFLSHTVSYFILKHSLHQTELAINTLYKKHFPAATSTVAPRERMQEKLKKMSSDDGRNAILHSLSLIGNGLHQSPTIRVTQLDFRENALRLAVMAPSFDALDSFSQTLKHQGLSVKQQGASISNTEVKANLIINTGVS